MKEKYRKLDDDVRECFWTFVITLGIIVAAGVIIYGYFN